MSYSTSGIYIVNAVFLDQGENFLNNSFLVTGLSFSRCVLVGSKNVQDCSMHVFYSSQAEDIVSLQNVLRIFFSVTNNGRLCKTFNRLGHLSEHH